jgi:hypothetical protein
MGAGMGAGDVDALVLSPDDVDSADIPDEDDLRYPSYL